MNLAEIPPDAFKRWEGTVAFRLFAERADRTMSVTEQIAVRLSDRILDGSMPPGQHLAEQEIADEFSVSRGPVRDAIRILEREGLVTMFPRRGTIVTELSHEELLEIFEIRAALISLVARKCAQENNQELIDAMRAGLAQLESLAENPDDGGAYAETVYRLLLIKAKFCGNRRLHALLTALSLQTLRYFKIGLQSLERRRKSVEHWRQSVKALQAGDADEMERVMRAAMDDSSQAISRTFTAKATSA